MLKKKFLIYFIFIFFILNNVSFSIENKILAKIEKEIITSIDVENEAKYLLALNESLNNFFFTKIIKTFI